jgi:transposase-like protein
MVTVSYHCPRCGLSEHVVRHGFNRGGSQRLKCGDCGKSWTPQPNTRALSAEKEALIVAALHERLSQRAIARTFKVARTTIRALSQKKPEKHA